jgi:carbonic anhydrase/acetyltransferase-like protein (isoleucine patch superfamily)
MPILPYLHHTPTVGAGVRLAEDAFLVGMVQLSGPASLESNAVLRGDQNRIVVGHRRLIADA